MLMNFEGKTVLVTGASRGIGRAIAKQFAQNGARVAIHYHKNRAAADETLAEVGSDLHLLVKADLANAAQLKELVKEVITYFGRLDILVNNAGIFDLHNIEEISYEEWQDYWQRTLQTNLIGAANLCYLAARYMIDNGGGRIVNISSRGAFRGEPNAPAYGASKAALNALGQSLAQALAPYKIIVGTVAPGWVATDMSLDLLDGPQGEKIKNQSPLKRVATPGEIANAVLFMASEGAEYTTGAILDVNGASYLRS